MDGAELCRAEVPGVFEENMRRRAKALAPRNVRDYFLTTDNYNENL